MGEVIDVAVGAFQVGAEIFGGSSSSSSSRVRLPGAKPGELTAIDLLVEQLQSQADNSQQFFDDLIAERDRLGPIQEELLQLQLDAVRQGTAATPEQLELIQETTDAALAQGESDIGAFAKQGLLQLDRELAPSLGLRSTDTPILDRGGQIATEATRQQGQLTRGLRGAQAAANLNFPLAAGRFESQRVGFTAQLAQAASAFNAQLAEQAFSNRLRLSESTGAGLGRLQARAFRQPTQTSSSSSVQPLALSIGQVGTGLGSFGGFGNN